MNDPGVQNIQSQLAAASAAGMALIFNSGYDEVPAFQPLVVDLGPGVAPLKTLVYVPPRWASPGLVQAFSVRATAVLRGECVICGALMSDTAVSAATAYADRDDVPVSEEEDTKIVRQDHAVNCSGNWENLEAQIKAERPGPNTPCWCEAGQAKTRSRKKWKECHGRNLPDEPVIVDRVLRFSVSDLGPDWSTGPIVKNFSYPYKDRDDNVS